MKTKVCTKCKKELPATSEYFYKAKKGRFGLQSKCRECYRQYYEENKEKIAKYDREYYEENREYYREYNRQYRKENKEYFKQYLEENKDRITECDRQYYEENKERIAEYHRKHYEENREYYREYREENKDRKAEYDRKYREENKDRIADYNRQHREDNKEYYRKYRKENKEYFKLHVQKRRTLKKNLPSTLTTNQWRHAQLYFNHSCAYCGRKAKLTQDHFWPLSKGGGYTATNIIPACLSCNSSKHNKLFEEWYPTHESYSPEREAKIYRYFEELALENGEQGIQRYDIGVVAKDCNILKHY